ncbi:MAG TPA: 2,3-bisphosphoglycerate-dependent phosphoglycerate mutase [Candidatus Bathyarchaeia archaeon]|nr:2,3-bisphosphoglycerate-dependent phosphoglycerate mutase [Candidatus Bathyarchaeia archaeon]
MSVLVLLRHGESQWNLENRFTGWVDVPLTEKGRAEAHRAGQRLKAAGIRFSRCFTSKLQRAQETLTIVLEELAARDLPVVEDVALNERHYGDLQGLDKAETARKYGDEQVHLWRRSYDIAPPGGESLKDTAARTLPFFVKQIAPLLESGTDVLVVAHGNSLRSIVMDLEKLSREQVLALNLATGVPLVYELGAALTIERKTILE